jgi:hypothetical protein
MQNEDQTNERCHVDKEDQKDRQKGGPRFPRFRLFTSDPTNTCKLHACVGNPM